MEPTPCTDGYYNLKVTASSSTECKVCPAGYVCTCTKHANGYCTGAASITLCPETYWCDAGTSSATVLCPAGFICPEGTFAPVPCPPGKKCDGTGNSLSSVVDCVAGYYCPGGSTTATIVQCDAGYYCPAASKAQIPCDIGTYNPDAG
jgi:hypothetical protein